MTNTLLKEYVEMYWCHLLVHCAHKREFFNFVPSLAAF
jgi:hypothetical protein